VRDLLVPIVRDDAEFLPVVVPEVGVLFVVHPLWPQEFDMHADVECNEVSGNITTVRRYSFTFDPRTSEGPRHLFRMRQAKDSAARDHGSTMSALIASEKVKLACERAAATGIVFKHACSAESPETVAGPE
jgi:hypothetical protein